MHEFEFSHEENREFAVSGRVSFAEIEQDRAALLADRSVASFIEGAPIPLIITNEQCQIVELNALAMEMVFITDRMEVLGSRLGEFFGLDHAFEGRSCENPDGCMNCNHMPAVISALRGESAAADGFLVMYPKEPNKARKYRVTAAPLSFERRTLAIVYALPM